MKKEMAELKRQHGQPVPALPVYKFYKMTDREKRLMKLYQRGAVHPSLRPVFNPPCYITSIFEASLQDVRNQNLLFFLFCYTQYSSFFSPFSSTLSCPNCPSLCLFVFHNISLSLYRCLELFHPCLCSCFALFISLSFMFSFGTFLILFNWIKCLQTNISLRYIFLLEVPIFYGCWLSHRFISCYFYNDLYFPLIIFLVILILNINIIYFIAYRSFATSNLPNQNVPENSPRWKYAKITETRQKLLTYASVWSKRNAGWKTRSIRRWKAANHKYYTPEMLLEWIFRVKIAVNFFIIFFVPIYIRFVYLLLYKCIYKYKYKNISVIRSIFVPAIVY